MGFKARKATSDDLDVIVDFNAAMATETEDKGLSLEVLTSGVRALFTDPSRGFYIVAEQNGVVAGCLLITTEWSDWRNAYFWWIQSVFVQSEHRRKGVYRTLHRFVERLARDDGNVCGIRLYVDRANTQAKKVYESLGMTASRYDFYESEF